MTTARRAHPAAELAGLVISPVFFTPVQEYPARRTPGAHFKRALFERLDLALQPVRHLGMRSLPGDRVWFSHRLLQL